MAIPLPDRGQPIDVTYIYEIVNEINNISNTISNATRDYTIINTRDNGQQSVRTQGARIIGGFVDIVSGVQVEAGTSKNWTFNYNSDFAYPPVAIATVVNRGSDVGDDVIAVINTTSTSAVNGIVKFNKSGILTISVNVLVIGIPTPSSIT